MNTKPTRPAQGVPPERIWRGPPKSVWLTEYFVKGPPNEPVEYVLASIVEGLAEALRKALPIIERAEWAIHNAAENQYCPECATEDERWQDQLQHHYGCEYIKIRDAARAALVKYEGRKESDE